MTGKPAASIPAGFTRAGRLVGLQIVGRHLDHERVLNASTCFKKVRRWLNRKLPPLTA
jgi:aspartyl-tRNA(Asn)/glutamyl-tRNA(Gln) amidotransferase subunit A